MANWDSVWIDNRGDVWAYPYADVNGEPGYMGLGKVDDPWSEAQIVAANGGPLRRLVPESDAQK